MSSHIGLPFLYKPLLRHRISRFNSGLKARKMIGPDSGPKNDELLVEAAAARNWKPGDGNAFIDERVVLSLGGFGANGARGRFLIEDLASLCRELAADVLGLGEKVVEHARIKHLGDGERIFAFHVRRLRRLLLARLRCRRLRRLGAEVEARGRWNALDFRRAARRAQQQPAIALQAEIVRRAEPALEAVAGGTK